MNNEEFRDSIKKKAKITQARFAHIVGVSHNAISNICMGITNKISPVYIRELNRLIANREELDGGIKK